MNDLGEFYRNCLEIRNGLRQAARSHMSNRVKAFFHSVTRYRHLPETMAAIDGLAVESQDILEINGKLTDELRDMLLIACVQDLADIVDRIRALEAAVQQINPRADNPK